MRNWKYWVAVACAASALHAHAGEVEFRASIKAGIRAAFDRGDFQAIEARYAKALANSEYSSSGSHVANIIRISAVPRPEGDSSVPGRDDHWIPVERKLAQWAAQFPQSALAADSLALAYIDHGWSWRGGGYARTVPPEGFRKFDEYTRRAYDVLMSREKVGRHDPYWYVEMLDIARTQGWAENNYMSLVREATTAFPHNHDIYYSIAYRLLPRWGGSTQAVANLADFAVKQTRKTEGESLYARIYWAAGGQLDADLGGPDVNWKRIRAGFDDIVQRFPDAWNLNHYARMACEARDFETVHRVLLRIKDDVVPTAWPDRPTYLRCRQAAGIDAKAVR